MIICLYKIIDLDANLLNLSYLNNEYKVCGLLSGSVDATSIEACCCDKSVTYGTVSELSTDQ